MQFVDLAGSERIKDAHNGSTNFRQDGFYDSNLMAGISTNYSLSMLSTCVRDLLEARKRGRMKSFSFSAYIGDLVPMLSESVTGTAISAIFVCLSQAPSNTMQSSIALDFGRTFSMLGLRPRVRPDVKVSRVRMQTAATLAAAKAAVERGGRSKYIPKRQAQVRDCEQRLAVLRRLKGE